MSLAANEGFGSGTTTAASNVTLPWARGGNAARGAASRGGRGGFGEAFAAAAQSSAPTAVPASSGFDTAQKNANDNDGADVLWKYNSTCSPDLLMAKNCPIFRRLVTEWDCLCGRQHCRFRRTSWRLRFTSPRWAWRWSWSWWQLHKRHQ